MFTNAVPYELTFMDEIPRILMKRCATCLAQSVTRTILRREIASTKYRMNDTALRDISSKSCHPRPNVTRYFVVRCKGGLERLQTLLLVVNQSTEVNVKNISVSMKLSNSEKLRHSRRLRCL